MKITIKEIAKMADVSVATVSRVINNNPQGVGKVKRQEILELIEKYNYTPNLIAKSMVTNKTQCIGLLIPDILNPFFQNLARGIEDYAMQKGYSVFFCNTDNQVDKYLNYIKVMTSKNVDGLIITGYLEEISAELDKALKNTKVVIIDRYTESREYCQITTENSIAAYEMTAHLLDKGHQRIACITGPSHLHINEERVKGYKKALEEAKVKYDDSLMFEGNFELSSGEEQGELIIQQTDATAIFCFNDMMAQGVYKVCRKLGKNIPEDISVVGFDDIYTAELMVPPLTTMKQPAYPMGEMAAQLLIEWMDQNVLDHKHIKLSSEIVIRESVKKIN